MNRNRNERGVTDGALLMVAGAVLIVVGFALIGLFPFNLGFCLLGGLLLGKGSAS